MTNSTLPAAPQLSPQTGRGRAPDPAAFAAAFAPTVQISLWMVTQTTLVCAGVLILLGFLADATALPIFAYMPIIAYGVSYYTLAKYAPGSFSLMSKLLFGWALTTFSGIAIAHGAYLPEILTDGVANGAFLRLAALHLLFSLVVVHTIESRIRRMMDITTPISTPFSNLQTHWWVPLFFIVLAAILAAVFMVGLGEGFPIFSGTDRFVFRNRYSDNLLFIAFFSNTSSIALFLGMISANTAGLRRRMARVFVVLFIILSTLYGEKFSGIVNVAIGYAVPFMLVKAKTFPWRRFAHFLPTIFAVLGIVLVTVPFVLNVYGWFENSSSAADKFLTRIASEGQLWFAADRDYSRFFSFDGPAVEQDWTLIKTWDAQGNPLDYMSPPYAGLYNLMADYMDPVLFKWVMKHGGGLAMALDAYLLKCYGWIGMMPLQFFLGFFFAWHLLYIAYAIVTRNPFRLFLATKLLVWFEFGLGQGSLFFIFGIKNLAWILLIGVFEVIWLAVLGHHSRFSLKRVRLDPQKNP